MVLTVNELAAPGSHWAWAGYTTWAALAADVAEASLCRPASWGAELQRGHSLVWGRRDVGRLASL